MSRVAPFARVIAPDMPGFGGAECRPYQDYTVAGYAAHLGGLLDQLGVNRAHLVATWKVTDAVAERPWLPNGPIPLQVTWTRSATDPRFGAVA
jgi:hypothetical protein